MSKSWWEAINATGKIGFAIGIFLILDHFFPPQLPPLERGVFLITAGLIITFVVAIFGPDTDR